VLLALRRWVWAPVWQTPRRERRRRLKPEATARRPRITMADRRPETSTHRPGPTIRAGPVAAADPAVRADPREDPVTPVAEAPADPVTQADTRSIIRGDPVAQAGPRPVTRTDPVGQADPAHGAATRTDPVAQAGHGAAIPSAVTSTGLRGGTARDPGDGALRRGQRGTGRFRRPVGAGRMAQSTTGVTTKRPCGIPDLTSGASGSSGSGSRCNR